jgi:hypothetical protein
LHILINDFIGGVLDRGIPHYVRNIIFGLEEEGFRVSVVRAPAICRKLPRGVFYLLAVLFEQTIMPLIGMFKRADMTLYPYNSVAVIDLLTRRGKIVIHDLEQLNRGLSPSKLYYLACYRALKWRKSPIFTIMELTRQRLIDSGLFGECPITILPVTFYAFEKLAAAQPPPGKTKNSILLCTGSNPNKDFDTVVSDYLPKTLAGGFPVAIVGLHKATDAARLVSLDTYLGSGQLKLCGQLTDAQVVTEYQTHDIVRRPLDRRPRGLFGYPGILDAARGNARRRDLSLRQSDTIHGRDRADRACRHAAGAVQRLPLPDDVAQRDRQRVLTFSFASEPSRGSDGRP